jgi:predicted NodU family carbamoyl transferase
MPYPPVTFCHDSAAALIHDGQVLMALEEERLDRAKHTNAFPLQAIAACLDESGINIAQLDRIAYFFEESYTDRELRRERLVPPDAAGSRALLVRLLESRFGRAVDPEILQFHEHHRTHAALAFLDSGFESSAVCVLDGNGEDNSLSLFKADEGGLKLLRTVSREVSLGHFYSTVTELLGFGNFDEYKVMGLAPYGDPTRYRQLISCLYDLTGNGHYVLDVKGAASALVASGFLPRRPGDDFREQDWDLAAALQEALERIVLHVLAYLRTSTGLDALCLGGGVAHNSTMNGLILESGLFDRVFVHPASHDGGAALGAALLTYWQETSKLGKPLPISSPYLGPDIGSDSEIEQTLEKWRPFVSWRRREAVCADAAALLADGSIIGWAQGRSEYGPRALGNRSVLADPRAAQNKDRINAAIKERESYRPFAPAVQDTAVHSYFDLPSSRTTYAYMGYVVQVKPDARDLLRAVTHVDATARVQIVTPALNPRFYALLGEFGQRTGVAALLNTSFNGLAEPIVQTVDDCVVCFLTTGLDYLVVGNVIVTRERVDWSAFLTVRPALAPSVSLRESFEWGGDGLRGRREVIDRRYEKRFAEVSAETYEVLRRADGDRDVTSLMPPGAQREEIVGELIDLWHRRLVRLTPAHHRSVPT